MAQWAYSLNGSSYTWIDQAFVPPTSYTARNIDLSGIASLQNRAGQVWFRLAGWTASSSSGPGGFGQAADVLIFSGQVIATDGSPVIGFVPSSGVQVHVSNTLNVAVSILPVGSGVQSWSVLPAPAGATSLSAGTFHFTPTAADDGGAFTLSVVATNGYGTTTGTLGIAVTEYLLPGTLEITFENAGEVKTSYDAAGVTLSGQPWVLDQTRIGDTASDLKFGARAARFGSFFPAYMTSSNALLGAGLGTISFWYAQYGGGAAGAVLVVEVATNALTGNWIEVGRVDANGVTNLTEFQTSAGINQAMYVRIRTDYAEGVGQVNVDNIIIAPYQAPTYSAYEQYLRQYNVTPGDSGTAEGEDWDGDGFTNLQEFNAGPQTNPYDVLSHP